MGGVCHVLPIYPGLCWHPGGVVVQTLHIKHGVWGELGFLS